jgi:beta-lactamase regulating signal transducer with metallopeptidase domain
MPDFFSSAHFAFFVELFVKSGLVLGVGLAAWAALRGRSAALRHFLLTVFLVGLLALPFLTVLPGGWAVRILPAAPLRVEPFPSMIAPMPPTESRTIVRVDAAMDPIAAPGPARPAPSRVAPTVGPAGSRPVKSPMTAFVLVWLLGAVLILGRLGVGLAAARRWTREGRPLAYPDWRVLLVRFRAAVSLNRSVRLRRHDRVSVPFTWGLWRPAVLMPGAVEDWSEDERSTALFHELAHVKRVDYLIMLLARLSLAVYWLNPLTWVVFRVLRREQEKACDELVLKAGIKPSTYAQNLLSFRSRMGSRWSPAEALLGLFGRTSFSDRLAAILNSKLNSTEVQMKTKGILVFAVVLALALVGLAHPAGPASDKAPKPVAAASAASAPAEIAAPAAAGQTAAAVAQEPEKEKKDKPKPEPGKDIIKKMVFVPGPGHESRIEVKVTRGGKVESYVFDGTTVNIKTDAKGRAVLVTSGGKEIELGDGAQVRLEVRGGDWSLHKEKEVIRLDKGDVFDVTTEGLPAPEGVTIIEEAPEAPAVVGEPAPPAEAVPPGQAAPAQPAPPAVSVPPAKAAPVSPATPAPPANRGDIFVYRTAPRAESHYYVGSDKGLEEKLKQIREQLKQVKEKKLSLDELDKSLAALEESLKHELKVTWVGREAAGKAVECPEPRIYVTRKSGEKPGEVIITRPSTHISGEGRPRVEVTIRNKEGVTMVFKLEDVGQEAYARLKDRIRKALPEGYKADFDQDGKRVVVTIKNPKASGEDLERLVEKLSGIIDQELEREPSK